VPSWWPTPASWMPTAAGSAPSGQSFARTPSHDAMAAIPPGRWTTYGDLAELVGTAAQPVGQHIAACRVCSQAQRVLGSDGRVRPDFAWTEESDERDPEELLRSEGVHIHNGIAEAAQRLGSPDLVDLTSDMGEWAADSSRGRPFDDPAHSGSVCRSHTGAPAAS
jgi:alkylated DNA nucleotide flippase Atl1